ncbi:MAG: hypothetical protein HGA45_15630, partial [Chloroflexales bacterium]|nr:hypothetical protein [Chloroflexales bacterium]
MNIDLAAWLDAQRLDLLPLWTDIMSSPMSGALPADSDNAEDGEVVTISPAVDVSLLYDAAIRAARGDHALFDEQLRGLVLAEGPGAGLAAGLDLTNQLCRSVRARARAGAAPAEALALGEALDELFARAATAVARAWDAHSRELIRDHEFIAESLDSASAAADRRALQLQALNVISQQLSAILEPDQLFDLV